MNFSDEFEILRYLIGGLICINIGTMVFTISISVKLAAIREDLGWIKDKLRHWQYDE